MSLDVRPAWRGQVVGALAVAGVVIVAAGAFVLTAHRVIGASMTPTLVEGQLVLADPTDREPDRSELVVFRLGSGPDLVKRVIAVPGDQVEIEATGPGAPFVRVTPAEGSPPLDPARGRHVAQPQRLLRPGRPGHRPRRPGGGAARPLLRTGRRPGLLDRLPPVRVHRAGRGAGDGGGPDVAAGGLPASPWTAGRDGSN